MKKPKFQLGNIVAHRLKQFNSDMCVVRIKKMWWSRRHTYMYRTDWLDGTKWRNVWCIEEELRLTIK